MSSTSRTDFERLLAHEGFLRALAGRLVADPAAADDIVQETWLAALRRPPDTPEHARGWLATVARNVARMRRRAGARRTAREHVAARPEAAPSAADVLERERVRRGVLAAVLRLDEPYRSTIVLRFYEGLPPREVAARLGVPVETVRTRIRRAVARMRADLDRRHGSRTAWTAALVPFAELPTAASATGGLLAMSLTTASTRFALVGIVLLLALGGAAYLLIDAGRSDDAGGQGDASLEIAAEDLRNPELTGRPSGDVDAASHEESAPEGPTLDIFRHRRPRGALRGIVLSGRTHEPVVGADVHALMERGAVPDGMRITSRPLEGDSARTDAEGRFVFEDLPAGAYQVTVSDDEEGFAEAVGIAGAASPWIRLYPLPERPGAWSYRVRVVDEDGLAVPGAEVSCVLGPNAVPLVETTDANGLAGFDDLPAIANTVKGWITASAEAGMGRIAFSIDGRTGRRQGEPQEIVLKPAGVLTGRLVAPGAPLEGTVVEALSMRGGRGMWANVQRHTTTADANGAFRFESLPAGRFTLFVKGALRMDLGRSERNPKDYEPLTAEVEPGGTAFIEIPLVSGGAIEGRVVTSDGTPVSHGRVEVQLPQGPFDYEERVTRGGVHLWRLDSQWPDARRFALTFRTLSTDAEGRYRAEGLLPGPYRVRVIGGEALAFDHREPVDVTDGDTVSLEHRLGPAGTLELATRPSDSIGIRRKESGELIASIITPRGALGAITIPGLPVGHFEIVKLHSDPSLAPVPMKDFEIRAGELTYVDVTDAGNARIGLRLLDGGRPVVGAFVDGPAYGRTTLRTDADGRVTWRVATFGGPWTQTTRIDLPARDAMDLHVAVPTDAEDATLEMPSGALHVVVKDHDGRRVPGARVSLQGGRETEPLVIFAAGTHVRTTDEAGVARFLTLPPGEYPVAVELAGGGGRATATANVAGDLALLEVAVKAPGVIRVRVIREGGAAAGGVRLGATLHPPGVKPGGAGQIELTKNGWRTDEAGRFVIEGVPEGTAAVYAWVKAPDGFMATHNARAEVEVTPGETVEVELELRPVR